MFIALFVYSSQAFSKGFEIITHVHNILTQRLQQSLSDSNKNPVYISLDSWCECVLSLFCIHWYLFVCSRYIFVIYTWMFTSIIRHVQKQKTIKCTYY